MFSSTMRCRLLVFPNAILVHINRDVLAGVDCMCSRSRCVSSYRQVSVLSKSILTVDLLPCQGSIKVCYQCVYSVGCRCASKCVVSSMDQCFLQHGCLDMH